MIDVRIVHTETFLLLRVQHLKKVRCALEPALQVCIFTVTVRTPGRIGRAVETVHCSPDQILPPSLLTRLQW